MTLSRDILPLTQEQDKQTSSSLPTEALLADVEKYFKKNLEINTDPASLLSTSVPGVHYKARFPVKEYLSLSDEEEKHGSDEDAKKIDNFDDELDHFSPQRSPSPSRK